MASEPPKVFISYNRTDRDWAEWIAGSIESDGYESIIQAWHFRPGENFVLRMQEAATQSDFTLAVLAREQHDRGTEREKLAAALVIFTHLNMPRERDEVRMELEKTIEADKGA
jgi:hypothetical protein